jgi:hypothetical protein
MQAILLPCKYYDLQPPLDESMDIVVDSLHQKVANISSVLFYCITNIRPKVMQERLPSLQEVNNVPEGS